MVGTWPTNGNFFLQSATNLFPGTAWAKVSTGPLVVSGLNTVIDSISKAQQFYRLIWRRRTGRTKFDINVGCVRIIYAG